MDIFHGCSSPPCVSIGVDPLFVGEFLAPGFTSPPSRYRDWRLLPGSPLIDLGVRPEVALQSSPLPTMHTSLPSGWTYSEPACSELQSFDWDHEGFGNPRISGPAPDIGFDEFQMFIMAGNYANDSNSHNLSGFMNPTVEAGRANRVMLFPLGVGGANLVRINGVYAVQAPFPPAPAPPPAWQQPPRTNRVINPLLPLGFQTRYISFSNSSTSSSPPMGVAMPWDSAAGGPTVVNYFVPWNTPQGSIGFRKFIVPDGEISTGYFGAQAVIHAGDPIGSPTLWSNLQFEYR